MPRNIVSSTYSHHNCILFSFLLIFLLSSISFADGSTDQLRALRLSIENLQAEFPDQYAGSNYLKRLEEIESQAKNKTLDKNTFEALKREALLSNPLLDFESLIYIKRSQNLMGLPQNWQGNCSLPRKGYDNEINLLTAFQKAETQKVQTLYRPKEPVFVGDIDLHFNGNALLFSMPGSHNRYQIWEMKLDDQSLRQVTSGTYNDIDNYDACYLPDGRIIFCSTGCFHGVPCVGGSDVAANLFIMNNDGSGMRQLCFDQDHNWCPTVLNNGRILYTRWEYTDSAHYFTRLLFHMNPDGTEQMEYYGSNSYWPNSMFYTRPIPGDSSKVVTIVSGHHGVARMGEMVLLDISKGRKEADGAIQRIPGYGQKVEPIIADRLVDNSWPKFLHPYPLNDSYFLVSSKPSAQSLWGLYLVDIYDNMVLIKEEPGYALLEPVPVKPTTPPVAIPDKVLPERNDATVYLADIYEGPGLEGVPRGTVKALRLIEYHYAYPKMGGHVHVAVEGAWDVHRILGTVPVEEDGSAMFTVPANMPLAVQPLDKDGNALQIMRSWFTAMPGENVSCIGCHEPQNSTPPMKRTIASRKTPTAITPWHGPARGFSFKREVQPVLDKYCIGCHDGSKPNRPDLRGKKKNGWANFTPAYLALHPYVRRPGPESDYHVETPLEYHSSTSELVQMLKKGHHNVELDDEAWDRLVTWIDLNVPDHGTWSEHRQIPNNYHQRRLEMRTRYANRPEDPEAVPPVAQNGIQFIHPQPKQGNITPANCVIWPFDNAQATQMQQDAANVIAQNPSTTKKMIDLGNGTTMELTLIPSGEFVMGNPNGPGDEQPTSAATIAQPFWMATTEVTLKQFQAFKAEHRNDFLDQQHKDHTLPGYAVDNENYPVIRVTWDEAVAYCDWLSEKSGITFMLPTEAQWEWACRAGSNDAMNYGPINQPYNQLANLADISMKRFAVTGINPQPIKNPNDFQAFLPRDNFADDGQMLMCLVGQYQPNNWGLYDMHGNVAEWTRSEYRPYPYQDNDGRNDLNASANRVVRGGSWRDRSKHATSSYRLNYRPYQRVYNVGFRVICPIETVKVAQTEK